MNNLSGESFAAHFSCIIVAAQSMALLVKMKLLGETAAEKRSPLA